MSCLDARDCLVSLHNARRLGRVQVRHELRRAQVVRPEQHALEQHCGRVGVAHVHCTRILYTRTAHVHTVHTRETFGLSSSTCDHLRWRWRWRGQSWQSRVHRSSSSSRQLNISESWGSRGPGAGGPEGNGVGCQAPRIRRAAATRGRAHKVQLS